MSGKRPLWNGTELIKSFKIQLNAYWLDRDITEDARKLQLLPLCLAGEALDYFSEFAEDQRVTYNSALERLESWSMDRQRPSKPLQSLTSRMWQYGEDLDSYVKDLRRGVRHVTNSTQLQSELLRSQFLEGLPDECRQTVRSFSLQQQRTFEDLVEHTRKLDVRVPRTPATEVVASAQQPSLTVADVLGVAATSKPSEVSSVRCWRCGRQGHTRAMCSLPSEVKCFRCSKVGHVSRVCKTKQVGGPFRSGN